MNFTVGYKNCEGSGGKWTSFYIWSDYLSSHKLRVEMAARSVLSSLLAIGFLLAGLIQYEISAGIVTFSAEDYADYILEAGYMTLYCRDYEEDSEFSEEVVGSGSREGNASDHFEGKFLQGNRSDWRHLPEAKVW
ncbi:hypothetical protein J437_LFUL009468 [Ladona fulva]|uniref:Uncharacterized protein n=1 Tax=Ladona fulva TaxID=123851 RepID=A0A8K0KY75_LADFU|nr:hypothetical protein J437_LFUL009468 [Ladona fulva]